MQRLLDALGELTSTSVKYSHATEAAGVDEAEQSLSGDVLRSDWQKRPRNNIIPPSIIATFEPAVARMVLGGGAWPFVPCVQQPGCTRARDRVLNVSYECHMRAV